MLCIFVKEIGNKLGSLMLIEKRGWVIGEWDVSCSRMSPSHQLHNNKRRRWACTHIHHKSYPKKKNYTKKDKILISFFFGGKI